MRVAALFVDPRGAYANLPGVEIWGEDRDARLLLPPRTKGRRVTYRAATPLADLTERALIEGIHDALSDLHRGPGTASGEPLEGCPGCEAQAMLDELARRLRDAPA